MAVSEAEQQRFMSEALAESRRALPACRPNPPVGCVVTREGVILARGFTGEPGHPHAEAAALGALPPGEDRRSLVMFVTLEPCAFDGRTPSCARAIVTSGIRTVYVGTIDPDPRNAGKGIKILRDAGLEVHVGVLEAAVLAFLSPYLLGSAAGG